MVGGLGIIIIFIMIIRHVGACVREGHLESASKKNAVENGYATYLSASGGERLISNDHAAHTYLDFNKGSYVQDFVTGEKQYTGWEKMLRGCDKDTANGCTPSFWCPDKSVYDNPIGTKRTYIDRRTHQVLRLYKASHKYDKENNKTVKENCFYFADENGNPVRKTQGQELIDKRREEKGFGYLNWSIDEIKNLPKSPIGGVGEVMWQKAEHITDQQMWDEAGITWRSKKMG